jgi:subtilisin family serine protease
LLAALAFDKLTKSDLKSQGKKSLKPLEHWMRGLGTSTRSSRGGEPVSLWSSGSAILSLTKKQLQLLPDEVASVAEIFPNRMVRVPPVSKATQLPTAVTDQKAYTWGLARSGALACWGAFEARGESVLVAVLDTGVDVDHPDLSGKIADFAEFGATGKLLRRGLAKAYDSDEHGTHVSGTIVGGCASGRYIGMAPAARVLAGLVLKNGEGTDAQILAGIEWAIESGAQVISMSLGGLRMSADVLDTYTRAIMNANRLGIPVIIAVGNEGSQTSGSPGNDYFAYTVGATDFADRAAGFSGGRTQVIEESRYIDAKYLPLVYSKPEVTAPGVDVYSAVPRRKWEAWSGTSMATPHVAGAMALLLSQSPRKKNRIAQLQGMERTNLLQSLLTSTVAELGEAGQNHRFGFGRIDVLRAFGYAKQLGYLD